MNRIINTLALATAGLVLLCGCSADPATDEAAPGGNDGKTVPVSFAAELPATRATIEIGDDRFNGAWEVDIDKLGIHATLNGVAQINKFRAKAFSKVNSLREPAPGPTWPIIPTESNP